MITLKNLQFIGLWLGISCSAYLTWLIWLVAFFPGAEFSFTHLYRVFIRLSWPLLAISIGAGLGTLAVHRFANRFQKWVALILLTLLLLFMARTSWTIHEHCTGMRQRGFAVEGIGLANAVMMSAFITLTVGTSIFLLILGQAQSGRQVWGARIEHAKILLALPPIWLLMIFSARSVVSFC